MERGLARLSLAGLFVLAGCASTALRGARADLTAGNYQVAHQELLAARSDPSLSNSKRREIDNDLCLSEYKLGAPAYSLTVQDHTCTVAATEGAEESAELAQKIEHARLAALAKRINDAIASGELGDAEEGIVRYAAIPGADQTAISEWSQQLWTVVKRQDDAGPKFRPRAYIPAIAEVARRYPEVHQMSKRAFTEWVEQKLTVEGTPLVSKVSLNRRTLTLMMPEYRTSAAALNLDRLALVNDGMVARCGCVGQTNVALQKTELPAYLVRLDPETRQSEILVLTHP